MRIPENILHEIKTWATQRPNVKRIIAYGSRVHGTYHDGSDLDLAFEITPEPNHSNGLATWFSEAAKWRAELQQVVPLEVHLEWHDPDGSTPTISAGLAKGSLIVYEQAD